MRTAGTPGIYPPLYLAQGLGTILSVPGDQLIIRKPIYLPYDLETSAYLNFLEYLAAHSVIKNINTWDLSDAVAGIVLAKLLTGVEFPKDYQFPEGEPAVEFSRLLSTKLDRADPAKIWHTTNPGLRPDFSRLLPAKAMTLIETNLHQLDIHELRFLHQYGPRFSGAPDPRELLDLFNLLNLPKNTRQILFTVLRLLPAVSQTSTGKGTQTYAMGGYQGLSRKGSLDSLIPTELAYPTEMFFHPRGQVRRPPGAGQI